MSWRSGVTVVGPDSRNWVVRRRWVPRLGPETLWGRFRRRTAKARSRSEGFGDVSGFDLADDVLGGVIAVIAAVIFLVIFLIVVVPLLVALIDILILLLLALLTFVFRVLFRRPWIVEAAHQEPPIERALRWKVVGWRASAERCTEIAQHLQAGITPPDGEEIGYPAPDPA